MVNRKRLEGRVALITGAGRGIGRAIALAYAAEGARLALAARTDAELRETAQLIAGQFGSDVVTTIADVTSRAQVDEAVSAALERYGAIDVLVNNAGNTGPVGRLWDNDPDEWVRTIAVHLAGHVLRLPGRDSVDAGAGPGPNRQYVGSRRTQFVRL